MREAKQAVGRRAKIFLNGDREPMIRRIVGATGKAIHVQERRGSVRIGIGGVDSITVLS